MSLDFLEDWKLRKATRPVWKLREPATVSATHKRPLGGRGEFAGVVISAVPADAFSFESRVEWPSSDCYDDVVREAALDVLLCSGLFNSTGVALRLDAIEWHPVDSSPLAFYLAARKAIQELAGFDAVGYPWKFTR